MKSEADISRREYWLMGVYQRIYHMKGSFDVPMHAYETLVPIEKGLHDNPLYSYNGTHTMEVNTRDIIGSTHVDYCDSSSWLEFLRRLKRIDTVDTLIYYSKFFTTDAYSKSTYGIGLTEHNSKYWINSGNHRICIAKILGLESIRVPVSRYIRNE